MSIQMAGMVTFPIEYVNNQDYRQAYMLARDLSNNVIKVHIVPKDDLVQRAKGSNSHSVPLISEFSKTGRKALKSCIAKPENSKNNPVGILLCEQVVPVGQTQHNGQTYNTFEAKWASNLRIDEAEPTPGIGLGFFEVAYTYPKSDPSRSYNAVQQMIRGFLEKKNSPAMNPLDATSILTQEAEKIFHTRAKRYSAIVLKHREIIENIQVGTPNELRSILEQAVSKYTQDGRYGVALIRVRRGNVVHTQASTRYVQDYNYQEGRVRNNDENWANFRKYEAQKLFPFIKDGQYSVDIIPAQRIYFGPQGVSRYDKEFMPVSQNGVTNPPSKMMKQFVDKLYHHDPSVDLVANQGFLASFVGVRIARIEDGASFGNEIASSIHSFSKVVAPAIAIRADLSAYQLDVHQNQNGQDQSNNFQQSNVA